MGNIVRTDVKTVQVTFGRQYAQYRNAIEISFVKKRARAKHGFMMTYKPFLVILKAEQAVDPDSMLVVKSVSEDSGVTLSSSRYPSFDERWQSDFMNGLAQKQIVPLFQIDSGFDTRESI
jgi:hypothetical protein